jgi:hypothetical protein
MRKLLIVLVLLLGTAGGAGYWYLARAVEPGPVPAAVLEAEAALAMAETVGLMHLDIGTAVRIERAVLGEEDSGALLAPGGDPESLADLMMRAGVDPRRSVDHAVAALVLGEAGPAAVAVLLGKLSEDRIREVLPDRYRVESTAVGGRQLLMLSWEDPESCTVSDPVALHLSAGRAVIGDPGLVGAVLERLEGGAAAAIDLAAWRAYREGKVLSLALLTSPGELAAQTSHPMARMTAEAAQDDLSMIGRVFAGASFQALPPRLAVEARVESLDPAWTAATVESYRTWRAELDAEIGRDLPALSRLTEHLGVEAEGPDLIVRAALGEDLLRDAGQVPAELLTLMFAGLGGQGGGGDTALLDEQVIPPEEVTVYRARLSPDELAPFDPELDHGFRTATMSGPIAVQVDAFRLAEGHDDVVEIEIDALSGEIPNMDLEAMHASKEGPRAQLTITSVRDRDGRDLLREEHCGRDRNGKPGELQATTRSRYVDNNFVQIPVVAGSKTVRLKPGVGVGDIAAIAGHVELRLPTRTETFRVDAPFDGQLVEAPEVRIKLSAAEPGTVKYEVSGRIDRVLATRALNGAGQVLRGAGAYGSERLLGAGKSIAKSFAGAPAAVEFVVATEETLLRTDFEIAPVAPRFDPWDRPGPYEVAAATIPAYREAAAGSDLSAACEARPADSQLAPFQLCPRSLNAQWGGLQGQFQVLGPDLPGLGGNLSGLELRLEAVTLDGGDAPVPIDLGTYIRLRDVYDAEHLEDTPWISAEAPESLENTTIDGVHGRLIARVPLTLGGVSLDVSELGSRVRHETGLDLRLVGFWNGTLQLDVNGPRDRIVQFIPRDEAGTALATNNARLDPGEAPGLWRASLSVSGRPATLDVIFAESREILEYPFEMSLGAE